jgi:RNA polymerase sigma factor (sigma-70 family)
MSPLLLRRYRADRLLREEFETLRERVIGCVEARMRVAGASLDHSDLEAAYAQAWQGLHAAVLEGQQIANPAGWLAVVTHRRALDERRARRGIVPVALDGESGRVVAARERDLAEELDDRARLRALLEALRARLSERERQAAALCYLQGLSRVEAAAQLGVSESRMRKLMEGAGKGLRGVAAKVGALVQAITGGEWCEEQGSLMRGFAFGILDPQGERYRLALSHRDACPACRAYVLSLRGLAAVLPPVPALLHPLLAGGAAGAGGAASAGALAGSGSGGAGAGAGAGVGVGAGATSAPFGAGALSASGAAGAGAASGGWWLAGGLGAKLAAGCLLVLGVGAGCVALEEHGHGATKHAHGHVRETRAAADGRASSGAATAGLTAGPDPSALHADGAGEKPPADRAVTAAARTSREFGLERPSSTTPLAHSGQKARQGRGGAVATVASAPASSATPALHPTREAGTASSGSSSTSPSAAAREFAPG